MSESRVIEVALFRKSLREWQAEFRRARGEQEAAPVGGRTLRPGRLARRRSVRVAK